MASYQFNPINVLDTTNATSLTDGGSMTLGGGISIGKDTYIGGNVSISGTTTSFSDNILLVNKNPTQSTDTGIIFQRYTSDIQNTDNYAGIIYSEQNDSFNLGYLVSDADRNYVSMGNLVSLNTKNITTGNINFTGDLYKNGTLYNPGSQWTTSNSDIFYTTGKVMTADLFSTNISGSNLRLSGDLYVGGTLSVVNVTTTNVMDINISTGTINVSGMSTLTNAVSTNISSGTLNISSGLTSASANITSATIPTLLNTNVVSTNISTGTIIASNTSTLTNITATNISSSTLIATTSISSGLLASTNLTSINASIGHLRTSSGATFYGDVLMYDTVTINAPLNVIENMFCTYTISTASLVAGNGVTTSTLLATTSVSSGLLSATNIIGNSISAGTLSGTTITGANLSLSGNLTVAGTLTTVNITSTNVLNTNVSAGTIASTNATTTNVSAGTINVSTGITTASAKITNLNSTLSTIGTFIASSGTIGGHLVPSTDITYDLGSSSLKWRDLYLSGNTIHLGSKQLSLSGDTFQLENISVIGTREATSTTSASVVVAGGVGISGKLRVAGTSYITNAEINSVTAANIVVPGFINTQINTIHTQTIQPASIGDNNTNGIHWWSQYAGISDTTYFNWGPVYNEFNLTLVGGISNISGMDLSVSIRITGNAQNSDLNNDLTGTLYIANSSGNLISTIYEYTVDNGTEGAPPFNMVTPGTLSVDTGYITVTIPQGGSIKSKDNSVGNNAYLRIQNPFVYINVLESVTNIPKIISTNTTVTNVTTTNIVGTNVSAGTIASTNANITNISAGSIRSTGVVNLTSTTSIQTTTNNYSLTSGALNVSGDIVLSGTELMFVNSGVSPPTMNGRNSGSKIVLWPETGVTKGDYSIGIENNFMWYQVPSHLAGYKFYQGTSANLVIATSGNVGIGTASPGTGFAATIPNAKLTLLSAGLENVMTRLSIGSGSGHYSAIEGGHLTGGATSLAFMTCLNASTNSGNPLTRMYISKDGNVGINTDTPAYKLDVTETNSSDSMRIKNTNAGGYAATVYETTTRSWYMGAGGTSTGTFADKFYLTGPGNGSQLVITTSGNVGLSTASPSQLLHIQKSGSDNYIKVDAGGTNTNWSGIMLTEHNINYGWSLRHSAVTDSLHISYQDNTPTFTNLVSFDRINNRVGINTASPGYTLDVAGTIRGSSVAPVAHVFGTNSGTNHSIFIQSGIGSLELGVSSGNGNFVTNANSGDAIIKATTNKGIVLQGNGGTGAYAYVTNAGVGINTLSPGYTLDVAGTGNFSNLLVNASNPSMQIKGTHENQTATLFFGTPHPDGGRPNKAAIICEGITDHSRSKMHFCLDNTASNNAEYIASVSNSKMTILPNGNVGIGNNNPSWSFQVKNGAYFSASGAGDQILIFANGSS
jgi:hypothetical protein